MAQFTVRIELHNAHSSTYNSVHKDLHHVGFTHITECNGIPYQMPHAEYNYEGNITKEALLEEIKGIVFKHVSSCGILVTQWAGQASYEAWPAHWVTRIPQEDTCLKTIPLISSSSASFVILPS